MQATASEEIDRIWRVQRERSHEVAQTSAARRIEKLRRLEHALLSRRDEIRSALWDDYRKPAAEVDLSEIYPVVTEARHAVRHLRRWMKPRRVPAPLPLFGSRSEIVYESKGVVLIISPWNFPINLTFGPLVSAIAAGNCAILKPSELTPNAGGCMKRIVASLFDESEVAVIEGDASTAEELLRRKFDHIFFTGSSRIGRIVMKAAAEQLTSVTLELGGKSPAIVDRTADLDEAAKRIAWGKFLNAGQVCIAPDYLIVDEMVREPLIEKMRSAVAKICSGEQAWIVNDAHASRLWQLLDSAVARGADVVTGGETRERSFAPTIVAGVSPDSAIMQQEIFGPLLPVLTYRDLDDAVRIVSEREKPLAMYIFSRSRRVVRELLARTTAGGTVINDTIVHFYQINLPFGGVGESGVGKAHGFYGFEAFSNARAVLRQSRFSLVELMYPPYTKFRQKIIDFALKYL